MKHLKTFENWTTDITGNYNINYGDKQPELSDIVIDTIKFIEDNFDNISTTDKKNIYFNYGLKYTNIYLDKNNGIPILKFVNNDGEGIIGNWFNYSNDITDYDYKYLKDYFLEIYKKVRKKDQDEEYNQYKLNLQKIEDEKIKRNTKKYNI